MHASLTSCPRLRAWMSLSKPGVSRCACPARCLGPTPASVHACTGPQLCAELPHPWAHRRFQEWTMVSAEGWRGPPIAYLACANDTGRRGGR